MALICLRRDGVSVLTEICAAAGVDVADNIAHIFLRNDNDNFHDRLDAEPESAFFIASLNAIEPAILNAISEESTS